jgi:hypothetical protein
MVWAVLLLSASLGCASGGKSVVVQSADVVVQSAEVVERQAGLAQDVTGKLNAKKVFASDLDVAAASPKPEPVATVAVVQAPQSSAGGAVELEKLLAPGRINIVAFEADW